MCKYVVRKIVEFVQISEPSNIISLSNGGEESLPQEFKIVRQGGTGGSN